MRWCRVAVGVGKTRCASRLASDVTAHHPEDSGLGCVLGPKLTGPAEDGRSVKAGLGRDNGQWRSACEAKVPLHAIPLLGFGRIADVLF